MVCVSAPSSTPSAATMIPSGPGPGQLLAPKSIVMGSSATAAATVAATPAGVSVLSQQQQPAQQQQQQTGGQAAATTTSGSATSGLEQANKCRNFMAVLLRLSSQEGDENKKQTVTTLIQSLIVSSASASWASFDN